MQIDITTILNKLYSIIKEFLSCLKKHVLVIQLVFAIGSILICSYTLYVWYRIPHKSVTYTTHTVGCIGKPKCKIIAMMDYGDKELKADSIGFFIRIQHHFREDSPFLFKGKVLGENVERKTRYSKEYEPLYYKYGSTIDSISTVYKSTITLQSNLYDRSIPKDRENWSNQKDITIWRKATITNKNTTKNESWFYLKRLLKPFSDKACLMEHRLRTSHDNFSPKWNTKGDVSKLDFELKIGNNDFIECDEIKIRFNGPYNLASINIKPDEISYDYISFTNPLKLKAIRKNGLNFYASFPIPEKIQQARITFMMIIIPLLISYLIYLLGKLTHRAIYKEMRLSERKG
ncbi:MAG: hypothetical protein J6K19_04815 [Prevotella sp.]|nr:hypothetical protein [Prevotella sp.]